MNRAVCYVQRSASGHNIDALRLVAPGLDREWVGGRGVQNASADATAQLARLAAAAAWIGENLRALGQSRLDVLCVDPDGAVCTWFSAASPDEKVVAATLSQSSMHSTDVAQAAVGGGGGAAGRLAMLASTDPLTARSELTLQPLAVVDDGEQAGGGRRSLARRQGRAKSAAAQGRFALLSIPDACVRALLDALDEIGIEVGVVTSLWHALAAAFDPSARDRAGAEEDRVVAISDPATAVLLIDPAGRMVWSWSRGGMLVAGGSMRLRLIAPAPQAADGAAQPTSDPFAPVDIADAAASARRIGEPEGGAAAEAPERLPEASTPEVGRLVADWLAWSAQLGASPQRVAIFGPATLPAPMAGGLPPSFGQALAKTWPGATVDMAEHDDPIGYTLQRLAGTSGSSGGGTPAVSRAPERTASDPRYALTSLSNRPGRSHRRANRWAALALVGVSVLVAMWGYQLHRSAAVAEDLIADSRQKRTDVLKDLEPLIPNLSLESRPEALLQTRLTKLQQEADAVRPAPPLLAEAVRLLKAFGSVQSQLPEEQRAGLKIQEISLSPLAAIFRLEVPDSETGPRVEIAVKANPGAIKWSGRAPAPTQGPQTYVLTGVLSSEGPAR